MSKNEKKTRVRIIGAGLAGLTAAHELNKLGISSVIYEASSRAGGRVKTVSVGRGYDELGGKEISDGGEASNLRRLCGELGCSVLEKESPFCIQYLYKGRLGDFYEFTKEFKGLIAAPFKEGFSFEKTCKDNVAFNALIKTRTACYEGGDLDKLPAPYLADSLAQMSEALLSMAPKNNKGSPGVRKVLEYEKGSIDLVERLTQDKIIHYGHKLEKITQLDKVYRLSFCNGVAQECDYIILAVSLPILKELAAENDIFSNEFCSGLDSIEMGKNTKVIIPTMSEADPSQFALTERYACWFNNAGTSITIYYGGNSANIDLSEEEALLKSELALLHPNVKFDWNQDNWAVKKWEDDPFTMGSYSHPAPGKYSIYNEIIERSGEKIRKIFAPVNSNFFIVGEHASINNPATMEGAVDSGIVSARLISSLLQ